MFFIVLLCVPVIDQGLKVCANLFLQPQGILPVINNALYLNYTETILWPFAMFERGAGISAETIISVLLLLAGYFTYVNRNLDDGVKWCVALILGGAFSNLIDMIRIGRVIGYFDIYGIPVFNIGDLSAAAGGMALTFMLLLNKGLIKEDSAR